MMLELKDIHVYYDKSYILQGVTLEVRTGEVFGVVGSNGVGKTTTLRTILGLSRAKQGTVTFRGQAGHHSHAWASDPQARNWLRASG